MNKQEIFDRVANHLLTQMRQAQIKLEYSNTPLCVYKTPSGDRCAIGCLLEDGPHLDHRGDLVTLIQAHPEVRHMLKLSEPNEETGHDLDFLNSLQRIHDHNKPQHWIDNLNALAQYYQLSTIVLDSYKPSVSNSQ